MYNKMNDIKKDCIQCTKCALCETRTHVVFGGGNAGAKLLLIGEAPGANEDKSGEAFVGMSGKMLNTLLESTGINRESDTFITNIVKCRPPQNRDPSPAERASCAAWLEAQIAVMKPKIIVCVGRIAAQHFIDKSFKVTKQHGEFIERNGVLLMGTFHPMAILRTPQNKQLALDDFAKLKAKMDEIRQSAITK